MRLVYKGKDTDNIKSGASFGVRVHDKKPSYFDAAAKAKAVKIDDVERLMILHPTRETSNRVNFATKDEPDTWYFVDNDALWNAIAGESRKQLEFVTEAGRAASTATPAAETEVATEVVTA